MVEPREALEQEGARTVLVSSKSDQVKGWTSGDWGDEFQVDQPLKDANPNNFDALVLPGV